MQRSQEADTASPTNEPVTAGQAEGVRPVRTILIVDDAPDNLAILHGILHPAYRVLAATSGENALRVAAASPRPDLILLDIMMPSLDGYQTFDKLRADLATRDIPVIFVTALSDVAAELRGLELGAVDFISKPVVPAILRARVDNQLEMGRVRAWLQDRNALLEAEVSKRMTENDLTQQVSIRALAHLAEARDPETGNHILRTQGYVQLLAHRLRHHPRFASTLTDRYIDLLVRSAPLHDVGKVGIPDHILLKPGKLDAQEWAVMKTHAQIGSDAIERAERDIDMKLDFLGVAKEVARWHHEQWNGSGYPDGLAGDAIPLTARIMAVADVFDALISPRVYKRAMPFAEARAIIAAGRGTHFDPDICDAFLKDFAVFVDMAQRYRDPPATPAGPAVPA